MPAEDADPIPALIARVEGTLVVGKKGLSILRREASSIARLNRRSCRSKYGLMLIRTTRGASTKGSKITRIDPQTD
jgi:hypothetical protein